MKSSIFVIFIIITFSFRAVDFFDFQLQKKKRKVNGAMACNDYSNDLISPKPSSFVKVRYFCSNDAHFFSFFELARLKSHLQ